MAALAPLAPPRFLTGLPALPGTLPALKKAHSPDQNSEHSSATEPASSETSNPLDESHSARDALQQSATGAKRGDILPVSSPRNPPSSSQGLTSDLMPLPADIVLPHEIATVQPQLQSQAHIAQPLPEISPRTKPFSGPDTSATSNIIPSPETVAEVMSANTPKESSLQRMSSQLPALSSLAQFPALPSVKQNPSVPTPAAASALAAALLDEEKPASRPSSSRRRNYDHPPLADESTEYLHAEKETIDNTEYAETVSAMAALLGPMPLEPAGAAVEVKPSTDPPVFTPAAATASPSGDKYLLYFGREDVFATHPGKIKLQNDKIVQVACGDLHAAFIAEGGRLFTLGRNNYGQLGLGHTNAVSRPSCVKTMKEEHVTQVACGTNHTLCATRSGFIFSFGYNNSQQCGVGPGEQILLPKKLTSLPATQYKQLAAGSDHSVALTESGRIFVWGEGEEGQLGLGSGTEEAALPTPLLLEEPVSCISAGNYHSAAVTSGGQLFTWGNSTGGKLGLASTASTDDAAAAMLSAMEEENAYAETFQWDPRRVETLSEPVATVSCGNNHTGVVTVAGNVFTFGCGSHGQLGLGPMVQISLHPRRLGVPARQLSCGDLHAALVTDSGHLLCCGDCSDGKLVLRDEPANLFVPRVARQLDSLFVEAAVCGGVHTLLLVRRRLASDPADSTLAHAAPDPLNTTAARLKRRNSQIEKKLSQTLPPMKLPSLLSGVPATLPVRGISEEPSTLPVRGLTQEPTAPVVSDSPSDPLVPVSKKEKNKKPKNAEDKEGLAPPVEEDDVNEEPIVAAEGEQVGKKVVVASGNDDEAPEEDSTEGVIEEDEEAAGEKEQIKKTAVPAPRSGPFSWLCGGSSSTAADLKAKKETSPAVETKDDAKPPDDATVTGHPLAPPGDKPAPAVSDSKTCTIL